MKSILLITLLLMVLLLGGCGFEGDPMLDDAYTQNVYPGAADTYNLGSEEYPWRETHPGDTYLGNSTLERELNAGRGGYWHEYNIDAFSTSPGASGATQIAVDADTLGGFRLDANTEYLYFTTHIEADWDGISNPIVEITFEVNINNGGGNPADTVDFDATCYHKALGDVGTTSVVHSGSTIVGQSARYKVFLQVLEVDFVGASIVADDIITFRINLDTANSEVDDVIANYFEFKYMTKTPARES